MRRGPRPATVASEAVPSGGNTRHMDDAVTSPTAGAGGHIVIAGAGYAGLHVALRLTAKLRRDPEVGLTLVDRHDYHQVITELPRVAGGTRAAEAVRIALQDVLATSGSISANSPASSTPVAPPPPTTTVARKR